jgi:hypothetical protein
MVQLVLRIARENRWMGCGKIAGEMRKLGFVRFGRSSVARVLKQHGLTPERRRNLGLGWLPFLAHYGRFIWASDFCTVTTATLRTYYLVFFLEIGTRRIIHWNVSTSPDETWMSQQFRNLSVASDDLPRHPIQDRDSKYTRHADFLLEDAGTTVIRLPVRSPDLNGYAERWIRTACGRNAWIGSSSSTKPIYARCSLNTSATITSTGLTKPCSTGRRRPRRPIRVKAASLPARCSAASSPTTAASPPGGATGSRHHLVPLPRA